jgi:hypothetical protein
MAAREKDRMDKPNLRSAQSLAVLFNPVLCSGVGHPAWLLARVHCSFFDLFCVLLLRRHPYALRAERPLMTLFMRLKIQKLRRSLPVIHDSQAALPTQGLCSVRQLFDGLPNNQDAGIGVHRNFLSLCAPQYELCVGTFELWRHGLEST